MFFILILNDIQAYENCVDMGVVSLLSYAL